MPQRLDHLTTGLLTAMLESTGHRVALVTSEPILAMPVHEIQPQVLHATLQALEFTPSALTKMIQELLACRDAIGTPAGKLLAQHFEKDYGYLVTLPKRGLEGHLDGNAVEMLANLLLDLSEVHPAAQPTAPPARPSSTPVSPSSSRVLSTAQDEPLAHSSKSLRAYLKDLEFTPQALTTMTQELLACRDAIGTPAGKILAEQFEKDYGYLVPIPKKGAEGHLDRQVVEALAKLLQDISGSLAVTAESSTPIAAADTLLQTPSATAALSRTASNASVRLVPLHEESRVDPLVQQSSPDILTGSPFPPRQNSFRSPPPPSGPVVEIAQQQPVVHAALQNTSTEQPVRFAAPLISESAPARTSSASQRAQPLSINAPQNRTTEDPKFEAAENDKHSSVRSGEYSVSSLGSQKTIGHQSMSSVETLQAFQDAGLVAIPQSINLSPPSAQQKKHARNEDITSIKSFDQFESLASQSSNQYTDAFTAVPASETSSNLKFNPLPGNRKCSVDEISFIFSRMNNSKHSAASTISDHVSNEQKKYNVGRFQSIVNAFSAFTSNITGESTPDEEDDASQASSSSSRTSSSDTASIDSKSSSLSTGSLPRTPTDTQPPAP